MKISIKVQDGEDVMIVEIIRPEKIKELEEKEPYFADLIKQFKQRSKKS